MEIQIGFHDAFGLDLVCSGLSARTARITLPPTHAVILLLSLKGKVYDISGWKDHPGGRIIFSHAGEDCTQIFTAFHPPYSYNILSQFLIGELDESSMESLTSKYKELYKAYGELRMKVSAAGLFKGDE